MNDDLPDAPLRLHIPEPKARPGDKASFAHLRLADAGVVSCPAPTTPEDQLRHLPHTLVRVLDDGGDARGEWDPRLDDTVVLAALEAMVRTRVFDERMFRAHRQGKTSFYMKSTGEEAIAVGLSLASGKSDMCFPTYRMLGWLMARGYPLTDLVNQIYSNAADPLKGRQLPILYSARDFGFYSLSGNLGSRIGHAVGWAMASAYRGETSLALGIVGDGTTAEGAFHEAMTFAAVYHAPAILCVTNNQWAISSFAGIAGGEETTFAAKALAYGIPGLRVDGNDLLAIWGAARWAATRARANLGATLIEFVTYRAEGHSTSDDPTQYRPHDEAKAWPLGDPVERLKTYLMRRQAWSEDRHQELIERLGHEVKQAMKAGEAVGSLGASKPPVSEMFEGVFSTADWRLIEQRAELGI
ncbi:3-methyl-2-oxobutanoate dehydrogenase (2-methylpropanoyl-transferring) subunit alpha [Sphingomonas sp. MG17]|uniref:2-oxoisovalerate dehydrogenase subunit alpha n=1 Tax=Sphingomonas tagetis TaxID=2949092 RepID=A0A9X2KML2_9SPHN|nr:thiamine pyrophosphate-dependent enzyme [Sphingomonas tagetis]MCP3732744.1 3-methyl-2-oxobutanoate dehydrogenase (2-methylpropanoyl-transferring) subunit alpha [Sphingomonas tagetis]